MSDKVRRRTSKWDVAAEHHVENEIRHDSDLLKKVDDPCMDLTEQDSTKPSISMNVDGSEIDQYANQSEQVRSNNFINSDDICGKPQYPKQFDLEGDFKDGFKKKDCDTSPVQMISQERTIDEYAENQDKSFKGACDTSPGPEERRQWTSNISVDGRSRSGSFNISWRKRSRSRSRSRSHSRSRSWNRSRSPSYVSKQGSERLIDQSRMRGKTAPCRDFAAGRCRRGSQCGYLHEGGGWRQIDRHHNAGLTDGRGSRIEREKHLVHGSMESLTDSREKNNYSREKHSRRHDGHYEDGWNNREPHHGYRSNEKCFDFIKGRCHRGASCRYIHHDASSDGGWSVRNESGGRVHDQRDGSASFSCRREPQRASDLRCKFFLKGHCLHGENCKFSHQVGPVNIPVDRSLDDSQRSSLSGGVAGNSTLAKASELHDQTTHFGVINHQDFTNRSLCDSRSALTQDARKETQPSEQQTSTQKANEELSSNNPLPTSSITGQSAEHRRQSQFAPQLLHAQNFAPNSSFQQFAPPLPLDYKTQQTMHSHPQNGQNQFAALQKPPDAHSFNASMQTQYVRPSCYELNPQNLDSRGLVQHNLLMQQPHHIERNFNLNGQIQQNGPLIHNAQSQPDFNVGQIQHNLASHIGHSHQDIIATGDAQQILPNNVQNQVHSVPSHASNGQNHIVVALQPSSIPKSFNSDDNNCQLTMENNSKSIQIGQGADSSEVKPSQFNSDNSITHKVVTSEQAAKIIDLSVSLAQFFGTAALNSQSTAGMTPKAFPNPASIRPFVTAAAPLPTEVHGLQTNLSEKPHQQIHVTEHIQQVVDSSASEVKKNETPQNNNEHLAQLQNGDAEARKDGDSKKIKEAQEIKMFKCALIDFVKDMLKPKWKEGQLSKEAHKTIVKKVVDKVSGSLQGPNVPQTPEKIDLYLLNSKAKLSKLVQAYVDRYLKS